MNYIERFENLGFGMFVHFGLYSIVGKGEWYKHLYNVTDEKYNKYLCKFNVNKNWAKNLVKTAKDAGAKYITITARHHDGFSLYDTKGLSDFDVMNTPTHRDLIKEFVDECNKNDILPLFYHTLIDWNNKDYDNDFNAYIDYLVKSIELLCTNYGKIGGFWFDGMWNKKDSDWQEDRLYGTIRKYQPEAMIINNTGLSELGKVGHIEIDSVTFERGNPCFVDQTDKHRAGEMCQIVNDHWGYVKEDINYKSIKELVENLVDCRRYGCNYLLNTGLKGNGMVEVIDREMFKKVGQWIRKNKNFIYEVKPSDVTAENAIMLKGKDCYYAVIKDVCMTADPNVALAGTIKKITVNGKIKRAKWLDNGRKINVQDNSFYGDPFDYGYSYSVRVAQLDLE